MQAISSRPISDSKVLLVALGLALALILALLLVLQPAWLPLPGSRLASETSTGTPTVAAQTAHHQASERADADPGAAITSEATLHQAAERIEAAPGGGFVAEAARHNATERGEGRR
jgi:hypothetical protein